MLVETLQQSGDLIPLKKTRCAATKENGMKAAF